MNRTFAVFVAALGVAAPAHAASLNVQLEGVRAAGGTLYVSVQTREQYRQEASTAGTRVAAPGAGSHAFSFELPPGDYAVTVWHDDNGNGTFDLNNQQRPLDGWAMTNSAALRGDPTFDDVRTAVGGEAATVHLTMAYGR